VDLFALLFLGLRKKEVLLKELWQKVLLAILDRGWNLEMRE